MPRPFRVGVNVPVTDEAQAALVTQKLQEASTIRAHIGAWVVRRHAGEGD